LEQRLIPAPFQPHFQDEKDTGNFAKPKKAKLDDHEKALDVDLSKFDPFKDF
jgi:hypothetical protein